MHSEPMKDSDGEFNEWKDSHIKCKHCGATMKYRLWESSCGGFEDYQYKCPGCDDSYWVEGPDS